MNRNLKQRIFALATTIIILSGMIVAWNPIHSSETVGFIMSSFGFTIAVFDSLNIINSKRIKL